MYWQIRFTGRYTERMQIYLVGGAVRDQLLELPVTERDWVVVGARPEQLIELGYRPIGRDFPVFLHPETQEEYALARTERKTGRGYHGFAFHASPEVTLEEDLRRRDLTINAMALSETGELIDPYDGQRDLKDRILRHVSPAFGEDPVRVLRVARFAARFNALGFQVADETLAQMRTLAESGELDTLTPERVFLEFRRALMEATPEVFVSVLATCATWPAIFPLLPDTEAIERTLRQSAATKSPLAVRFACLSWHSRDVDAWCQALRAPRRLNQAAQLLHRHFSTWSELDLDDPSAVLALIESLDAMRRPQQFEDFRKAAMVLSTVQGLDRSQTDQQMQTAHTALLDCDEGSAARQTDHRSISERVHEARLETVRTALIKS